MGRPVAAASSSNISRLQPCRSQPSNLATIMTASRNHPRHPRRLLRRQPPAAPALVLVVAVLCTAVWSSCPGAQGLVVRTPATKAYVTEYVNRMTTSSGRSVVELGGWDAIERRAIAELASTNFDRVRGQLPPTTNWDVVGSGGWNAVKALSADPKGALLNLVKQQFRDDSSSSSSGDVSLTHLDAIAALLQAQGKGFDSTRVDGEWRFVLQRQARKSPLLQRFVAKKEKPGNTQSNFDVKNLKFHTIVSLLRGWLQIVATVRYRPVADNFELVKNKTIVLRRIACDIIGGSIRLWKLPKLPLPLRVKGGYLDFVYLDDDVRVTRGNRGGLFVHARPETVEKLLAA